jgi:hypothetical protein
MSAIIVATADFTAGFLALLVALSFIRFQIAALLTLDRPPLLRFGCSFALLS